jgi:hypothetical protein
VAFSLVSSTIKNTAAAGGGTTDAIDTTGADLIVLVISQYSVGASDTPSDSKGNTWAGLTVQTSGDARVRLFYASAPTAGSGHTFAYSVSNSYATITALAFSGAHASPFDQENGAGASAASIQPGSVTPTEDNELVVCGLCTGGNQGGDATINGGFTLAHRFAYDGNSMGGAGAYLIQATATAANPTWSWPNSGAAAAAIATFKAAAGGGGGGTLPPIPGGDPTGILPVWDQLGIL